jgi:Tol biopolymer transport system component
MSELSYLNFDLLIERLDQGYTSRVLESPVGSASAIFEVPFSELEIENLVLRIGRTRRGVRRLDSPEMEAIKVFGNVLFTNVFRGEVRGCFRSSLDEAKQKGVGLRIRLRLGAPELFDLPWEYLYYRVTNQFFSLSVTTPLVRYLSLPGQIQPMAVKPPLRVLAMIASPRDYPSLDIEREWAKLRDAAGDLERRGQMTLERLEEATLSALQKRLRQGAYHIFHFIGHGAFDERAEDGVLLLEDREGRGRPVSGQYLGTLLHDEPTLRLAILNSCEGARTSRTEPFAGTAQSLVQQGTPAVIAMQFEITDEAAITFAYEFYGALADAYPVDAALAEARKAIFAQGNDVEWGTPVLYMRTPDGRIFDLKSVGEEERKAAQAAALYRQALAAVGNADWDMAVGGLERALALDPQHEEARSLLRHARQRQRGNLLQRFFTRLSLLRPPRSWLPTGMVAALVLIVVIGALFIPSLMDDRATFMPTSTAAPTPSAFTDTPKLTPTFTETPTPTLSAFTDIPKLTPTFTETPTPTPSATPTGVIPPTQESTILFVSARDGNDEIYAMRPDGSMLTRLTNDPATDSDPHGSPDGASIGLIRGTGDKTEVYAMDRDGLNLRRLTYSYNTSEKWYAWSHDGQRIVAEWERDEKHRNIYILWANGEGETPITGSIGYYWNARWSPTEDRILFLVIKPSSGPDSEIMTMDPSGDNLIGLTDNDYWDQAPAWSPDGSQVSFVSHRDDVWQMFVTRADGRQSPYHLFSGVDSAQAAAWSPEGNWIAVVADRDGDNEIYVMQVDGTHQKQLTKNNANDRSPSWSPDGTQIVFESDRDGQREVYIIDRDGRNEIRLTESGGWSPSWWR